MHGKHCPLAEYAATCNTQKVDSVNFKGLYFALLRVYTQYQQNSAGSIIHHGQREEGDPCGTAGRGLMADLCHHKNPRKSKGAFKQRFRSIACVP